MAILTASTDLDVETARLISDGLNGYNRDTAGPHNDQDLWIVARDGEGRVAGGLKGSSEYTWLFVEWLWVASAHR